MDSGYNFSKLRKDSSSENALTLAIKAAVDMERNLEIWKQLVQLMDNEMSDTMRRSEEWQEVVKVIGRRTKDPIKSKEQQKKVPHSGPLGEVANHIGNIVISSNRRVKKMPQ